MDVQALLNHSFSKLYYIFASEPKTLALLQSNFVTKQLKSCIYKFYGCINLKIIFRSNHRINSFFPYKDKLNRSLKSKVVYKASCWDCNDFYIGKTKRRLHDRKSEHSKHSRRVVKHQPLRITSLQLAIILNGTILKF